MLHYYSIFVFPAGGKVGGWVLKLKLMLTQPPTKFELEPRLSLAKTRVDSDRKRKVCLYLY